MKKSNIIIGVLTFVAMALGACAIYFYVTGKKCPDPGNNFIKQKKIAERYNQLLSVKSVIGTTYHYNYEESFKHAYKDNINANINNYVMLIRLDTFLKKIGLTNYSGLGNWENDITTGVNFQYILAADAGSQSYFSYAFYTGPNTITSTSDYSNVHWIGKDNLFKRFSSLAAYQEVCDKYLGPTSDTRINAMFPSSPSSYNLREIMNNTIPAHPMRCFHTHQELFLFLEHNKDSIFNAADGSVKPTARLEITNGALNRSTYNIPSGKIFYFQAPLFVLWNHSRLINDTPYPRSYVMKGMNLGKLCPTDCN